MLIFLKNTIKNGKKIEELMRINFERKPQFCTNAAFTTKPKIFLSYSEEYRT